MNKKIQLVTTSVPFSIAVFLKAQIWRAYINFQSLHWGNHMHHIAAANRHGRASQYQQINDSSADAFSLKAGYAPGLPTPCQSISSTARYYQFGGRAVDCFHLQTIIGAMEGGKKNDYFHCFCGHSNTHIDSCSLRRAGNKQVRYPIDGWAINLSTACQRDNYRTLASYVGSSTYYITNFLYTLGPIR